MHKKTSKLILCSLFFLIPCITKAVTVEPYELRLKSMLQDIVVFFSQSKKINIEMVPSEEALEYKVFYQAEDHAELHFLSGLRLRSIRSLFNELSISAQKTNAQAQKKKFDYYKRKVHIITFHNLGLSKK